MQVGRELDLCRLTDRGRGTAVVAEAQALYCAVTEVTLDGKGWFAVDRVVVAGDTGFFVNPNSVEAQVECSVALALSSGDVRGDHHRPWSRGAKHFQRLPDNCASAKCRRSKFIGR